MKTIKQLNEYCILHARNIKVHAGKHTGYGTDYKTEARK